jgi:LuxR family maltose regulon positive regulatory protein
MVFAPAGYGKTTLAARWAQQPEVADRVAWVALEDGHNEPFRFWTTTIAAIAGTTTGDIREVLLRLRRPLLETELGFASVVAEVLDAIPDPTWLVLDDIHNLHSAALVAELERLLTARFESVRFVLVGRSDPTNCAARLRVSGDLCEIRASALAFEAAESEQLLDLLGIGLEPEDLTDLQSRTEGWVAGIRLAAASLAVTPDRHAAIRSFTGDRRAVADYLFEEVFRQLQPGIRTFLLSTCVPEELPIGLARELSGRPDAGDLLQRLCTSNVLVAESGDRDIYRYHHLLGGYLRAALARTDPDALVRQHDMTARWLAAAGRISEAITYARAGASPAELKRTVEFAGLRLILDGGAEAVQGAVRQSTACAAWPTGVVLSALAALQLGNLASADEMLAAGRGLEVGDDRLVRLFGVARIHRSLFGGDVRKAVSETGIADWARVGDPDLDLIVLAFRGAALQRVGDYSRAMCNLEAALGLAQLHGHDEMALWLMSELSGVAGSACDFRGMDEWSARAIEYARPRGWADSPRLAYAYLLAAWTGFQTGSVDAQQQFSRRAMECLGQVTDVEIELGVRSMSALAEFEASDGSVRFEAAKSFRELWQTPVVDQVSPALIGFAAPQEARLALNVGEYQWAVDVAERVDRQLPGSAEGMTLRAAVLAYRGRNSEALATLRAARRDDVVMHVRTTGVQADVLEWRLHEQQGNAFLAHQALGSALEWAAPRNYRRPFLEIAEQLRNTFETNLGRYGRAEPFVADLRIRMARRATDVRRQSPAAPALTNREFEVLRDLPSMMDAGEIASARGVSVNTVKTHVAAIYRKLGVTGRREAVREARRLGLL